MSNACSAPVHRDGALALLPGTDGEVVWTRVWLALQEFGRSEPGVGEVIVDVRGVERDLLTHLHPELAVEDGASAVLALVDGPRVALCEMNGPLAPAAARDILRRRLPAASPPEETSSEA